MSFSSIQNHRQSKIFTLSLIGGLIVAGVVGSCLSALAQNTLTDQESITPSDEVAALESNSNQTEPLFDQQYAEGILNGVATNGTAADEPLVKEEPPASVEINGDQVEFSMEENKVIAQGNVSVKKQDVTLLCDRLEFFRATKFAVAEGHVVLIRSEGRLAGDKMHFNFGTMTGDFVSAKIYAKPFFGVGEKIEKVGENHMRMEQGYLTTCDHDKPHFRMKTKKVDIYPGDKIVARNVRLFVGNMPLVYIPRFTQDISNKRPLLTYTPGYDKQWGAFLLTTWNIPLNEYVRTYWHADYRERLDLGLGFDMHYDTKKFGDGLIRTYYTNQRKLSGKHHFWQERLQPTVERERFKGEWRHKWEIDEVTNAVLQYYKLSDGDFLKDFYRRENENDTNVGTFFTFTRGLPAGIFSFNTSARVNRFSAATEKLPELRYDLSSQEIADSNFYVKNTTTFTNFTKKLPRPSEDRKETMRFDTTTQVDYPFKISFLEIKPFVGGRETYYSKTIDPAHYNSIRGIFLTGSSINTKFYRIFDYHTNALGLDIKRLRHIISPSISYAYTHDPTMPSAMFDQFDETDTLGRAHSLGFGIENKLQTKRNAKNVDLARMTISTNFNLKENPGKGGFNSVTSDIELTPYNWLLFDLESRYDTITRELQTVNFDIGINGSGSDKYWLFSKRWNGRQDDQITSEIGYKINQKWRFRIYDRFDLDSGTLKEQEYNFRRDMHEWILDINFNQTRGEGDEIWIVFTLKDFPEMGFDFGTSFNRRKAGSQLVVP